jgi:hypothetical protein
MPRDVIPEVLEDTMARLAERAKSPSLESLTEAPPFFFGKQNSSTARQKPKRPESERSELEFASGYMASYAQHAANPGLGS